MNKKITWISINEWYMQIDELIIKKLIKDYWYDIKVISNNNNISYFYSKKSIDCINVWNQNIEIKQNLEYFLNKYWFKKPEKTLWQREIKILWRNKKYVEKSSLEYFNFFEDYFSNTDSEILFHNGDHYFHLIAEKVAKHYNKKIVYHNSIWLFPWKMVFSNSWKYTNFFNSYFLEENIEDEEKNKIESFIDEKINKKPLIWWRRKLIWLFHVKKLFYYIKNYLFIWKYRKDYRFPFLFIKDISYRLYNLKFNKINYDTIDKVDENSFFLPLHVPNDAQITTREYNFADQYELIKKLLKNIPSRYSLIIKEHPHWRWMLNMKKIEKLKKEYNNFFILEPFENAYSIIEKSKAVITINSDVWYESILYWKKPITLWNSFYTWYWYNIDYKIDEDNLESIINYNKLTIEKENIIKFIYSLQKVHKDCIFFKNSRLEFNTDKENISKTAFYIDNFIKNEN